MIDAKKPHDIAVSHQGPGADDWMFYCSCGVSGVLESEDLADARAEAHRNELKPRPPEPSFLETEVYTAIGDAWNLAHRDARERDPRHIDEIFSAILQKLLAERGSPKR